MSCTVCPKKCHWRLHINSDFRYELYSEEQQTDLGDLMAKYEKTGSGGKLQDRLKIVQDDLQMKLFEAIKEAHGCIVRVNVLAKPSDPPMTIFEYINLLIVGEQTEMETGYEARAECLEKLKDLLEN